MSTAHNYAINTLLQKAELPSLPDAIIKLGEAISDDASLDRIVELIEIEPSMSARVLQLANSAWYHCGHPVDNIREAVTNIGLTSTYQLVVVSCVIEIFHGIDSTLINIRTFWRQSLRMGCAANVVAEELHHPNPLRLFTCGMLAYIGKLVLNTAIASEMQKVMLISRDEGRPQFEVERELLATDHAAVGAALLESWNIPRELYAPIAHFYSPSSAEKEFQRECNILNLAHYMQYTYGHDIALTDPPGPPAGDVLKQLGIALDSLPELSRLVDNRYQDARSLFLNG